MKQSVSFSSNNPSNGVHSSPVTNQSRRGWIWCLAVLAGLVLFASTAISGTYHGGTGTAEDSFLLATPANIQELKNSPEDWDKLFRVLSPRVTELLCLQIETPSSCWNILNAGIPITGMNVLKYFKQDSLLVKEKPVDHKNSEINSQTSWSHQAQGSGRIQGRVTGPGGVRLQGILVWGYGWDYGSTEVYTDNQGDYVFSNLPSDTYIVRFSDPNGVYASQFYNNRYGSGDYIDLGDGEIRRNVNAIMAIGGRIQGKVTGQNGTPLENIRVSANGENGWSYDLSNEQGEFNLGGLFPGLYKVGFFSEGEYFHQYYDNKTTYNSANNVRVSAGQATRNINASLRLGGWIEGMAKKSGNPLPDIQVYVVDQWNEGEWAPPVAWGGTNQDGHYIAGPLESGTYRVCFGNTGAHGLSSQCYNRRQTYKYADADDIDVTEGQPTSNINAIWNTSLPGVNILLMEE
ncbi:carboxypeptidase-like regulatory domain-containing protein [Desulfonatronum sp. SC1]|uniref:carboxypeptidase-like regulatory domain-containing protein n=1 Tax=Desulfonatronum sp. SC1 TaxID=2109626 RepID=UPI001304C826|nr:carboxypeptidase-like regulatory domain-containing protein [Desulfonatronum sp. SC1]